MKSRSSKSRVGRASIAAGLLCSLSTSVYAQTTLAAEETSILDRLTVVEALIRARFASLVEAIPRIPDEFSRAAGVARTDMNSGRPGMGIAILVGLILFGYLAEYAVRRLLSERSPAAAEQAGPVPIHRSLLSELPPLLVFAFASAGLFLIFDWPPLLKKAVLTFLAAFILFRLIKTVARLVTEGEAAQLAEEGAVPSPDQERRAAFWQKRVSIFAGIFLFGWAIVSLMPHLQFSNDVRRLVAYAFGIGLLAVAVEIVWCRPGVAISRRKALLLTLYLVVLWLLWVVGLLGVMWIGIYALVLPTVVSGVGRISQSYASGFNGSSWRSLLAKVLISRGARALVIIAAILWLIEVSQFSLAALSEETLAGRVLYGFFNAIVVLLLADLIWHLAKAYIDHRLAVAEHAGTLGTDEAARVGRLRTLLPIFRNCLAVLILVIAVLTILAGLGVQIAPLIAGAGIFGVAIGFGSQTLVKDVLSGVFFMLDDAFRVGEYIQSGSYKGTVESFSLRSVRLRHHRGPIFTVPFGELGAVQNMSRDWVMEKWTINITYDSDVEKARKLIKKIGAELAADPEYAASTLEPLKMQGVDNFGDYAIVLKVKLKTRPGEQFGIKRKAFVMIKKAFEENGIRLAVPTVEVSGGGDSDSAAVAQAVANKIKAAAPPGG